MKILRTYLIKEFLGPLLLVLGVLSFVMVMVGNLQRVADLVINKGVDMFSVGKLMLLMAPYIITYALPISVLIAVILSFGRLAGDNEIIAIRASGVSVLRLIIPILIISLILSLALVIFNDKASSYAHFVYRKTLVDIGIKNPTAAFEEGVFINSFEKYVLFIYRVDQKNHVLHNIRIYEPQGEGKPTRTIVAKSGEFITNPETNAVKLKLISGTSDEPDPENPTSFYKLNFKTYFMNLSLAGADEKKVVDKKTKEMNFRELRAEIEKLRNDNINPAPVITELQEKLALAFSCFFFALIGIPLGIRTRRREKSLNIGIALLVIIIYYPLFIGCKALGMENQLDPALAMWIPNILFGIAGLIMVRRICVS